MASEAEDWAAEPSSVGILCISSAWAVLRRGNSTMRSDRCAAVSLARTMELEVGDPLVGGRRGLA